LWLAEEFFMKEALVMDRLYIQAEKSFGDIDKIKSIISFYVNPV